MTEEQVQRLERMLNVWLASMESDRADASFKRYASGFLHGAEMALKILEYDAVRTDGKIKIVEKETAHYQKGGA